MVASGRWSFTRSGRTWRHDCTLLNEAKHPPPLENRIFPGVWHFLAAKYYCFYRVQDRRSQIWFLVPHSARWMGIRLDFVCTLFVACATFTGVFTTFCHPHFSFFFSYFFCYPHFFHPHFSIRIRHPQISGPRFTDTPSTSSTMAISKLFPMTSLSYF